MLSEEIELERYPDRLFFWGVALTVLPEWSNNYIDKVIRMRKELSRMHNLKKAKTIRISDDWMKQLS